MAPVGARRKNGAPGETPPANRPVSLSGLLGQDMQDGPLMNMNELNAKVHALAHDVERIKHGARRLTTPSPTTRADSMPFG